MKKVSIILIFTLVGCLDCFSQKTIDKSEYVRNGDTVLYKDSLFTGVAIKKADNGQITVEEHYQNGLAHGLWKEWYKTGERKFEGSYNHGKNDGEWIQWLKDGTVQRKLSFENGVLKRE